MLQTQQTMPAAKSLSGDCLPLPSCNESCMSLLSVLLSFLIACLQFSIQREKLEDRLDSLAEQHLSAAAHLATSQEEVERLQMQVDNFQSQLQHAAHAAVCHPKAHLVAMTGQHSESQSTAANLKQQLQDATLQLQHVQSTADESARREAAEAAAASPHQRPATRR